MVLTYKNGNSAEVSSVTQILRRLSSELSISPDGESISRSELLARYLWELALCKQATLTGGEIVRASNSEWLEIVFRVIERMEGKPLQSLSAEVNTGVILNRIPRMSSNTFENIACSLTVDTAIESNGIIKDPPK